MCAKVSMTVIDTLADAAVRCPFTWALATWHIGPFTVWCFVSRLLSKNS